MQSHQQRVVYISTEPTENKIPLENHSEPLKLLKLIAISFLSNQ